MQMRLEQCSFLRNSANHPKLVADIEVAVFGDESTPRYCAYRPFNSTARLFTTVCDYYVPRPLSEAGAKASFLTASDAWLNAIRRV
jgi:hypothetical protein